MTMNRQNLVTLQRRTTYDCGVLERTIVKFLWKRWPPKASVAEIVEFALQKYGPTKGRLVHMAWKDVEVLVQRHGPTRGRTFRYVEDALKRLEKRNIIEIS